MLHRGAAWRPAGRPQTGRRMDANLDGWTALTGVQVTFNPCHAEFKSHLIQHCKKHKFKSILHAIQI